MALNTSSSKHNWDEPSSSSGMKPPHVPIHATFSTGNPGRYGRISCHRTGGGEGITTDHHHKVTPQSMKNMTTPLYKPIHQHPIRAMENGRIMMYCIVHCLKRGNSSIKTSMKEPLECRRTLERSIDNMTAYPRFFRL